MAAAAAGGRRAAVRAILLMIAAMAAFVANDTIVKTLTDELPLGEIIAVRGVAAMAFIAMVAASRRVAFRFRPVLVKPVLIRAALDTASTIAFLAALVSMPIANITAVLQAVPLVVTLIGALFLGEAVGWRRGLAIAVGFAGVIFIVKPAGDGAGLAEGLALSVVLFVALRDVVTRRIPHHVPSVLVALVQASCITAAGAVMWIAQGHVPLDGGQLIRLAAAAAGLGTGYVCMVATIRAAPLSVTAPARYSIVLFAIAAGIAVFGEWPDRWAQLGIFLIVASGLYAIARERKRKLTPN